jgi:hypothetical protein
MTDRMVTEISIKVWPRGMRHSDLADTLRRIAGLVEEGCYCGDVPDEDNDGGWWETVEGEG